MSGKTVTDISAGENHSCAVAAGAAYCWGSNSNGQLGTGDTTTRVLPEAVGGLLAGKTVTAVTAGQNHTCAIADGSAYCWGLNMYGRLGTGDTVNSPVPAAVSTTGVLSGKTVTALSAGENHTCAVASGVAACWGFNSDRAIGGNPYVPSTSPVPVITSGVLGGKVVTAISSGENHTCAIANAELSCWGSNGSGQLGNGSTATADVPGAVAGALAGKTVTSVSSGARFTCAVADGSAYCWGTNGSGQLGTGDTTSSLVPVAVSTATVLSGKAVMGISAAAFHVIAFYE